MSKIVYEIDKYENQIWEMLKKADTEFIPPLSSRNSTTQKDLSGSQGSASPEGPIDYFNTMKTQPIIIVLDEATDTVMGFMSYIPYKEFEPSLNMKGAMYASTMVVSPQFRGHHVATTLYSELIRLAGDKDLALRTWSTNAPHLKVLSNYGFTLEKTLPNDRGEGIDTVYFTLRH